MSILAAAFLAPWLSVSLAPEQKASIHRVDFKAVVNAEASRLALELPPPRQSPQPTTTRWQDRHPIAHRALKGACVGALIGAGTALLLGLAAGEGPGYLGISVYAMFGGGVGALIGMAGK